MTKYEIGVEIFNSLTASQDKRYSDSECGATMTIMENALDALSENVVNGSPIELEASRLWDIFIENVGNYNNEHNTNLVV